MSINKSKVMIFGAVGGLIALILIPIVINQTISALSTPGIGSFAGVSPLIALLPVLFVLAPIGLFSGLIIWAKVNDGKSITKPSITKPEIQYKSYKPDITKKS